MSESTIPLNRAWNSWNSELPAEMCYLPLGLRITPCAYASSTNAFTDFPAGRAGVKLGPRAIDGSGIELALEHAGTALTWRYDKPDPSTLRGSWQARRFGEWGLRFWVVLVVRLNPPGSDTLVEWTYDPSIGELAAATGATEFVIRGERPPLLVTFHDSLEALRQEFETKGYFYLDSRGERGRVAALRYHLEEMPSFRFAATMAHDRRLASVHAASVLAETKPQTASLPSQTGAWAGALEAVRDVIGWNTVWDGSNRRPYTSLSRNWVSQKFGGWGVWLDDVLYHGLMAGLFDTGLAHENLEAVLAGATAQGNLPCLMTGRDSWIDRSQPPIGAFIVWMLYLRTGAHSLLELAYDTLRRNHDWWWRVRDGNGDGLVEYGTSPVGSGLYRGTKLAAKDESSMDNSPTHDEAALDTKSWTLDSADVGLNSLLALDGEMLAKIARTLGREDDATRLTRQSDELKERIRTRLWDVERQVFANRLWSGKFVRSLAPTSFYPLLCGAASPEQAKTMVALLHDPQKFGGDWLLPSVTRDDPAFADNVYWRGRVWPPLNFLVWHGLKRYGLDAEATRLAQSGYRLFMAEWAERRCPENFNAVTGAALDQPDTDSFYGWGALLPYLAVAEVTDINPWNGWEICHGSGDQQVGPLQTPAGEAILQSAGIWLTVSVGGEQILRASVPGRYRWVEISDGVVRMILPPVPADSAALWLELPRIRRADVIVARIGGRPIEPEAAEDGTCKFRLPAASEPLAFELLAARQLEQPR
jgi:putative isomerase